MSIRFLALGDSYTIGEGVAEWDRWPSRLAALLAAEGIPVAPPVIVAVTGWTTDELDTGIEAAGPLGTFGLVSLLIGVNDQYRGRDAEAYRPAFRSLLARAVSFAGGDPARVLVLSIPDWSVTPFAADRDRAAIAHAIDRFNVVNAEETGRAGARYVDITPLSRRPDPAGGMLAGDGLHPSGAQYADWALAALPQAVAACGIFPGTP